MNDNCTFSVAIGGAGSVGMEIARELDKGIPGLELTHVAARNRIAAHARFKAFRTRPAIVGPSGLSQADIVIEAAPASAFDEIVEPAIAKGRIIIIASCGALLVRPYLIGKARMTGSRLIVPSGALVGLDAVKAAAQGTIHSVKLETRKPPAGLSGAPYLLERGIDLMSLTRAQMVFSGSALQAAVSFPSNTNVAAALALAGIGGERTKVEIWADPAISSNFHAIHVESEMANFSTRIVALPSAQNPKSSRLVPLSIISSLRNLRSTLTVGV